MGKVDYSSSRHGRIAKEMSEVLGRGVVEGEVKEWEKVFAKNKMNMGKGEWSVEWSKELVEEGLEWMLREVRGRYKKAFGEYVGTRVEFALLTLKNLRRDVEW